MIDVDLITTKKEWFVSGMEGVGSWQYWRLCGAIESVRGLIVGVTNWVGLGREVDELVAR